MYIQYYIICTLSTHTYPRQIGRQNFWISDVRPKNVPKFRYWYENVISKNLNVLFTKMFFWHLYTYESIVISIHNEILWIRLVVPFFWLLEFHEIFLILYLHSNSQHTELTFCFYGTSQSVIYAPLEYTHLFCNVMTLCIIKQYITSHFDYTLIQHKHFQTREAD